MWTKPFQEREYNRFWNAARAMRTAQRAGDAEAAAEFIDEIEVIALHTKNESLKWACYRAIYQATRSPKPNQAAPV